MNSNFVSRIMMEKGLFGLVGLGVILLGLVLICVAPYIVASRRQLLLLIGAAILLGLGGYVVHDHEHVILNLSMRDAQAVRRACADLLQEQTATGIPRTLRGSQIPASLSRLGAKFVEVDADFVGISLTPEDGLTGRWWGFLYAPKLVYQSGNPPDIRATWYRDFYEILVRGE